MDDGQIGIRKAPRHSAGGAKNSKVHFNKISNMNKDILGIGSYYIHHILDTHIYIYIHKIK